MMKWEYRYIPETAPPGQIPWGPAAKPELSAAETAAMFQRQVGRMKELVDAKEYIPLLAHLREIADRMEAAADRIGGILGRADL